MVEIILNCRKVGTRMIDFKRINIALSEDVELVDEKSLIWEDAFVKDKYFGTVAQPEKYQWGLGGKERNYIFPSGKKIFLHFPEYRVFPPSIKHLGEMIAFDESNQFFITTYSPYFLSALLEKTPKEDLAVFVVYRDGEEVKKKQLSEGEIVELMTFEPFFNLHQFIEQED